MKKIITLIFLTALAGTAICQQIPQEPNRQLSQLADYLEQKGAQIKHEQSTMFEPGITHSRSSDLHSIKKDWDLICDSICKTFNSLDKVASKFYHYECHIDKLDTIKYSLLFCRNADKTDSMKGDSCDNYKEYYESASFSLYRGCRYFTHTFTLPTDIDNRENIHPFDTTAFKSQIMTVIDSYITLKGAKTYPVYWRHDHDIDDTNSLISYVYNEFDEHIGLTTGTHYYIPLKYKEEVEKLYKQLDSVAYNYVNNHPEQLYTYTFTKKFPTTHTGDPTTIVEGNCRPFAYIDNEENYSESYNLSLLQLDDGYHILSITTKNELWIPYEWNKLRSWINCERIYLKGMKPTPKKK